MDGVLAKPQDEAMESTHPTLSRTTNPFVAAVVVVARLVAKATKKWYRKDVIRYSTQSLISLWRVGATAIVIQSIYATTGVAICQYSG